MRHILQIYALFFASMAILADQFSKQWAVEKLGLIRSYDITPFFNFTLVYNKGIAFGLFRDSPGSGQVIMTGLALLICLVFLRFMFKTGAAENIFSYGLIIGGALGNVIDRIVRGAVVDFLDFHLLGYHWPAFNLADSFIFVGILVLVITNFRFKKG